jgi:hypothetical protein
VLTATDEDALVETANRHLAEAHPQLAGHYSREDILFMAEEAPPTSGREA